MKTATKVCSVSTTGRVRKTTAYKQSTQSRINQLVRELGIDAQAYKLQASLRLYTKMSTHATLGVGI